VYGTYHGGALCFVMEVRGRTPREAMGFLVAYGLAERRPPGRPPRRRTAVAVRPAAQPVQRPAGGVALEVGEPDVARWGEQLAGVWPPSLLGPAQRALWSRSTLRELGCGWGRGRIMIPIRGGSGSLRGVLRYAPRHDHAPKMLTVQGTRLGLVPHPVATPGIVDPCWWRVRRT
jgi:hypothetical protein